MESDLQILIIRFDDSASTVYSDVYNQFRQSIMNTDRHSNENIYKMQEAKALFLLKSRLDQLVSEILEKNQGHPLYSRLHSVLSSKIDYYLQEFRLKAASQ